MNPLFDTLAAEPWFAKPVQFSPSRFLWATRDLEQLTDRIRTHFESDRGPL